MQEYISKTVRIQRDPSQIFPMVSDMNLFAQAIPVDQLKELEDLEADSDACSFKVKGMEMGLRIINREPFKTVKFTGYGKIPFEFFIWIQMKEMAAYDTRLRIVLHVKMNMMAKMMMKGKIQKGLDAMVDQFASAMNGIAPSLKEQDV